MTEIDKKKCGKCQGMKEIELFEKGYRTCNTCRENSKRYQERHREQISIQKKEYREQNKEAIQEKNRKQFLKNKDEIISCPVCNCDIKKYKKSQHEKSQTHQRNIKKLEDPDFENDLPKPDLIKIVDGKEHYYCHACRNGMLACMWRSHCEKPYHIARTQTKKTKEET